MGLIAWCLLPLPAAAKPAERGPAVKSASAGARSAPARAVPTRSSGARPVGATARSAKSTPARAAAPSGRPAVAAAPAVGLRGAAARREAARAAAPRRLAGRTDVRGGRPAARLANASAGGRAGRRLVALAPRAVEPARPSVGQAIGLHAVDDPLDLKSAVALVTDQRTGEVLLAKNPAAVLPIASITKVMTSLVVLDAQQPLAETLEIGVEDIDTEKGSRSRLRPGTRLTRAELLQLALMSSENRAAHALGRHYPGGLPAFVSAMNTKARQLGMASSNFADPTGLSERNVSNAHDLARMLRAAYDYPLIRQFSTAPELTVDAGYRMINFRNTNRLIDQGDWSIGLQKTGYIAEAGRCLVMQANIESRPVLMVLLDSVGRHSRFGDAQRIRDWLGTEGARVAITRVKHAAPARTPGPVGATGS